VSSFSWSCSGILRSLRRPLPFFIFLP
jgi:hypothetical protein